MNFKQLEEIAKKFIVINYNEFPANAFELARRLNLCVKNSIECKKDFKDKYPLYNCNAVYTLVNGEYTIYYDEKYVYKNFSVAHEIAHHLLEHCTDGAREHHDANLLAAILLLPPKNTIKSKIKNAIELSEKYLIPYNVACEYWAEIKNKIPQERKIIKHISFIICLIAITILSTSYIIKNDERFKPSDTVSQLLNNISPITNMDELTINQTQVTVTVSGKKYHLATCSYLKNKNNLSELDINKAIEKGYEPCSRCFP